ncbi:MAG: hypothetical protein OXH77_13700 [Anaerolineaceae bacterium]|nr:hypothetical protein [Anaerolineaceae bacterium]
MTSQGQYAEFQGSFVVKTRKNPGIYRVVWQTGFLPIGVTRPGTIEPGVCVDLTGKIDLAPTLPEAAGEPVWPGRQVPAAAGGSVVRGA